MVVALFKYSSILSLSFIFMLPVVSVLRSVGYSFLRTSQRCFWYRLNGIELLVFPSSCQDRFIISIFLGFHFGIPPLWSPLLLRPPVGPALQRTLFHHMQPLDGVGGQAATCTVLPHMGVALYMFSLFLKKERKFVTNKK